MKKPWIEGTNPGMKALTCRGRLWSRGRPRGCIGRQRSSSQAWLHTTHYTLHTTHYTLHTLHYTLHTPPALFVAGMGATVKWAAIEPHTINPQPKFPTPDSHPRPPTFSPQPSTLNPTP